MTALIQKLEKKAFQIRQAMLEMCIRAGTGHVTSSLSSIDILVALYYGGILRVDPKNPEWEGRDRFLLSHAQVSPALYAILGDLGFFDKKELDRFAMKNGRFGVHLQSDVPGVEITAGSLGQGFGISAGVALGARMSREPYLVFTLLGDGECYEGSVWETAMFAGHHRLNNLVAIVDRNFMCVTDFTENIVALEPMDERWRAFGWNVARINGHCFESLLNVLRPVRSRRSSQPLVIIADTVKGEGVESISNVPLWHGVAPRGKEAETCRRELKGRYSRE
ncbi:MAG: transketolase [Thermodesulfobacteriota bacterium]